MGKRSRYVGIALFKTHHEKGRIINTREAFGACGGFSAAFYAHMYFHHCVGVFSAQKRR
jgi:hypothetical protein